MGYSTTVIFKNDHLSNIAACGELGASLARAITGAELGTDTLARSVVGANRDVVGYVVECHHNSTASLLLRYGGSTTVLGDLAAAEGEDVAVLASILRTVKLSDPDRQTLIAAIEERPPPPAGETFRSPARLFDMTLIRPATVERVEYGAHAAIVDIRITVDLPVRQGHLRLIIDTSDRTVLKVGIPSPLAWDGEFGFDVLWPDDLSEDIGCDLDLNGVVDEDRTSLSERIIEWLIRRLDNGLYLAGQPETSYRRMMEKLGDIATAFGPDCGGSVRIWGATPTVFATPPRALFAPADKTSNYDHRIDGLFRLYLNHYKPAGGDLEIFKGRIRRRLRPYHFEVMAPLPAERTESRLELIDDLCRMLNIDTAAATRIVEGGPRPLPSPPV